ncbi:hypothetical protein TRIUR3_16282 [Triticum urartu]|uniref:Uncharacterized protein n=1 Tax=Triticum urartu TaxID=4572 RepID=M8ASA2_TRIUA|nr:hypothetical protein TRIUR3_16282 [Triticum urartu]
MAGAAPRNGDSAASVLLQATTTRRPRGCSDATTSLAALALLVLPIPPQCDGSPPTLALLALRSCCLKKNLSSPEIHYKEITEYWSNNNKRPSMKKGSRWKPPNEDYLKIKCFVSRRKI